MANPPPFEEYEQLINEYRKLLVKRMQFVNDVKENKSVLDTLMAMDDRPDRRCYRILGGLLMEQTLEDCKAAIHYQIEQMQVTIAALDKQTEEKIEKIRHIGNTYGIRPVPADTTVDSYMFNSDATTPTV